MAYFPRDSLASQEHATQASGVAALSCIHSIISDPESRERNSLIHPRDPCISGKWRSRTLGLAFCWEETWTAGLKMLIFFSPQQQSNFSASSVREGIQPMEDYHCLASLLLVMVGSKAGIGNIQYLHTPKLSNHAKQRFSNGRNQNIWEEPVSRRVDVGQNTQTESA